MERISYYIEEERKREIQKERKEEERKKLEWDKKNVILMLDFHRKFAKESLFGHFVSRKLDGRIETIESEEFKILKDSQFINFTTFARFMTTDEVINSYSEDTRVHNFTNNLIERYEYNGQDLEWNISMIDIEILFESLRDNQFIAHDTPRNIFFEIFNPNLSIFYKPIQWKDVKELVYFFDKCVEYGFIENNKYQLLIEKYRMFTTKDSKGDYLKSRSLSVTLSDVKNGTLNTVAFQQRTNLIDEFLDYVTM